MAELARAGVIGSGAFGTGAVAQFRRVPRLEVPVIAEKDLGTARKAPLLCHSAAQTQPPSSHK